MEKHKVDAKNSDTGQGTVEDTEPVSILNILVFKEEITADNRKEDKEKESAKRALASAIQKQALYTVRNTRHADVLNCEWLILIGW